MEKLSKEEVMHVANLARIYINDDELEKYSVELKTLMNEIDKIKDVEVETTDMMVTPVEHEVRLRNKDEVYTKEFEEFKPNAPKTLGNFMEVVVMVNE